MVVLLAMLGIGASLLAYAISPSVRHAVGHAAHSVKGAVGHVLDRDHEDHPKEAKPAPSNGSRTSSTPAKDATKAKSTSGGSG